MTPLCLVIFFLYIHVHKHVHSHNILIHNYLFLYQIIHNTRIFFSCTFTLHNTPQYPGPFRNDFSIINLSELLNSLTRDIVTSLIRYVPLDFVFPGPLPTEILSVVDLSGVVVLLRVS